MFRWIVRHARWLARVPGAPQFFDAALLTWTALFHRERLAAMEMVEDSARSLHGVMLCTHRFGGIGFALGTREFAHLHGNGLLDCRLLPSQARELARSGQAAPHHVFPHSAWVSLWIRSPDDARNAVEVLRLAVRSLPAPTTPRPPRGCSAVPRP